MSIIDNIEEIAAIFGWDKVVGKDDLSGTYADAWWSSFADLPPSVSAKLSMIDLREIYRHMVIPTITMAMDTAANEIERLRAELADGDAGAQRRILGKLQAVPPFLVDGSMGLGLGLLQLRIERLPASLDQTAASSLCSDLRSAADGDRYAMDRVEAAIKAALSGGEQT